jgi:chromosome segregation ATPase
MFRRRTNERLAALEAALEVERTTNAALVTRLAAVESATSTWPADRERIDARLAEISQALADQVHELAGEMDAAQQRAASTHQAAADTKTRIDELLAKQARIANEVARHQIALRGELAALAHRLGVGARVATNGRR